MNPIDIIMDDHNQIRALLKQMKDNTNKINNKDQKALYQPLWELLIRHESMEQAFFYPALEKLEIFNETIKHLKDEEEKAEKTIKKLNKISPEDDEWTSLFLQLVRDVEHHAKEEETKLFPRVLEEVPNEIMEETGKRMMDFKRQAKKLNM